MPRPRKSGVIHRSRSAVSSAGMTAPLGRLASDSATVIGARLARLPWQWALSPVEADRETRLMVSEKSEAAVETWMAICQSPWHFWADALAATMSGAPQKALSEATRRAGKRIIAPAHRRVQANRRRLGVS